MAKRIIQTHWNGKIRKLAGIIAGATGEENRRLKRPIPHFGLGRYISLFEDGRIEIDPGANEADVIAMMDSIGAIGKEYTVMRKVLLKRLSGSAAFRDQKRKSELAVG